MIFRKAERRPRGAAAALYAAAVTKARSPELYAELGAPDTVEGRFELLTLHVILILDRLRGCGSAAADASQALFDLYCSNLDGALREMGVGDLIVGKRMKVLGGAFYGRAGAYRDAFAALPDESALSDVIGRTILDGAHDADPAPLATYVAKTRRSLADLGLDDLLAGASPWPTA